MNRAKHSCLVFFLAFLAVGIIFTCGDKPPMAAEASPQTEEIPIITGVDLQDYSITVRVSEPFSYTLYKPEDPYRIVVELLNVSLGAFNTKIVSEKAGITEIVPSQVETPSLMARLDILLQMPSQVEPEYRDNELILRIKEGEAAPEAEEEEGELEAEIVEEEKFKPTEPEEIPLPKATEVTNISFEKSDDYLNIIIKGDGSMTPDVFPLDHRIVIDIPDVVMKAQLPTVVVSPLEGIRSGKHDGKTRLVLDLKEKTDFDVVAIGDSIVVALALPVAEMPAEKIAEEAEGVEVPVEAEHKYTGKRISLDFQDADIVPIFRLLADISGYNIVVSPEVKGRLTMKLINVPWDQALDIILKTFSLGKSVEDNIIRIAPHSVFARENEEAARAQESGVKAEPLETRVYFISYAKVQEVEKAIKSSKILTSRGSVSIDERTSSVIIYDVSSVFPEIEDLIATLDKETPQVLIEARIVEVSTSDVRDLGIQWGFFWQNPNLRLSPTLTGLGPTPLTGPALTTGAFTGRNFMVDLPAAVSPGTGAGFTLGILSPGKTMGLDFQLSALEELGRSRILGSPRVVTTDNRKATIKQGTSEPYPKIDVQSGQISADYKDVVLEIDVIPHITPAGAIGMEVNVKKEDVIEFVSIGGNPTPRTSKVEETTNVLIQTGETLVIGGIYKKTLRKTTTGVPGLMSIPVLGPLFKKEESRGETLELLLFITPRTLERTI